MNNYIIATNKDFHSDLLEKLKSDSKGHWHLINFSEDLNYKSIKSINPKYIFFLHWSEKIKPEIYENFNCIVFHMTDLPYGRGGSPLQNLIIRGHTDTMLSAIKVVEQLDAGDVYLKKPLSLNGSAREIFSRAAELMYTMINQIIETNPTPMPQSGTVEVFKRRKPEESNISEIKDPKIIYDYIRMLDADGYPAAFFENTSFKFEFTNAELNSDNTISANVRIIKK
jgi:methionyl-tRNA formyltransferase